MGKTSGLRGPQVTLNDYVQQVTPLGFNHPIVQKITRSIAEMITLNNQPFSIVDDIGFICVMKVLEPRYTIPSRRYFAEVAIYLGKYRRQWVISLHNLII